ncbi:ATP-dependent DNA helicase DinG [Anaerobacillus isosaccharinicus]|uniref:3'-5' exonuclease DinG n=1 Tax=Anaerobacillus isosaccharinicus TaxID=1532552 RepID=A0A1S2KXB8_9BACI|nr:ATP-dependent DNA helicase DinG [Anaerobacillus isosaccharinicus]MBA5585893.1 ATP-dependent DNA helicase DinG [Anaerobacillus isosaccharinicus]QOY35817.1 ATP-dependent DNA helicase DinG [Anaerobacillus isosaccharinicus]
MKNKFVVVDLETTGNNPKKGDRIIQIGVVVVEDGKVIDRFSSFINPEINIPAFIQQFTGINDEMVADAPLFSSVAPTIMEFLNGAYFVAHNVPFDLSFLQYELDHCGYNSFSGPIIDTVELARLLLPSEEGFKLNHLATKLNLDHDRPHQADSDAQVTAEILMILLKKLINLPLLTLQRLKPIASGLDSALDDIIQTAITEKLTKVAHHDENLDEFRQLVLRKPAKILKENSPSTVSDFKGDLLEVETRLSAAMKGFEIREGQKEMMALIDDALLSNQHLLVEAGTGTGKSLAYLLPGLYFAKKTDTSLVISTHTVNLQQQLVERDMVILKEAVSFPFRSAVLKGRSHYICLRKFEQKLDDSLEQNYDTLLSKGQILIWLTETLEGDVEQLNLPSGGKVFWSEVQSDAITCIGKHCPWFSRCFYHRARTNAYGADLIITNHALLFTDMTQDHQLLPSYKHVIIDEAHHLEEVASDHFGIRTDYFAFHHLFSRIGTLETKDLLYQVFTVQEELGLNLDDYFDQLVTHIVNLKVELDDCFRLIHATVVSTVARSKSEVGKKSLRYYPHQMTGRGWREIQEVVLRVQMLLKDALKLKKKITDELTLEEHELNFSQTAILTAFKGFYANLSEEKDKLEELLLQYDPNYVYWIEVGVKGAKNATYIYSKPIEVSEIMADNFFNKKSSVIMTSATLTVKNSFNYIIKRLGLEDYGVTTKIIDSPFNYSEQVQLMVPTTLPNIKEVDENEYIYEVVTSILDIAKVTKGRMLVLFTSYDMLRKAFFQLKDFIENEEFVLIGQGISSGSRAKLTKNFKQFDQAILFGTSSFWEGVDIPGEDLSCLIIVRLPFSPPDNPIFEARSEKVKELGKSPFMELSLPQAIIRFKQGFGRLIRSSHDRGAVFIFDRRITETRYGKLFIQSLPSAPLKENSLEELLYDLEKWL